MILSNFHTHTSFCDGYDTPESIVLEAISMGFDTLGFSDHSHTAFDPVRSMSRENTAKYIKTVNELKEKYRDKIKILCGVEQDLFSDMPTDEYDYVIGAVHHIIKDGEYIQIDKSPTALRIAADKYFGGDLYSLAEEYYANMERLASRSDVDVMAHFDLVALFSGRMRDFDENNKRYKNAALHAMRRALENDKIIEINTFPVRRGFKVYPYPSEFLLKEVLHKKGKILFSSDSHKKNTLDNGFGIAQAYAYECGFSVIAIDRANDVLKNIE
ncbi:MAG: histidinol-phosphatase HisJ family protein [Firmicutes bacterium]|nr:histidinol-phosphatase HisJ family protein [Bacillota bacterium]